MIRLPFRSEFLPAVLAGRKTATIRVWRPGYARRYRASQAVHLAFGRRDRPELVPAVIEAVEEYADLDRLISAARAEDDLALARLERLLAAIEAAEGRELGEEELGDALADLLAELEERPGRAVYAVWFRLAAPNFA